MNLEEDYNPYQILNVPREATSAQIKEQFISVAQAFDPDSQPPELKEKSAKFYEKLELAYIILINPFKRYIFDSYGAQGLQLCYKKSARFDDLGERFIQALSLVEGLESKGVDEESNEYMIAIKNLEDICKKIEANISFVESIKEEEDRQMNFQRECNTSIGFDFRELTYATLYREKLERPPDSLMDTSIKIMNFGVTSWFCLPKIRDGSHMLCLYGGRETSRQTAFGFKYRFQRVLSQRFRMQLSALTTIGDNQKESTVTLTKYYENGLSVSGQVNAGPRSVNKIAGIISKELSRTANCSLTLYYMSQSNGVTVNYINNYRGNIQTETTVDVRKTAAKIMPNISVELTPKIRYFTEITASTDYKSVSVNINGGFKARISAISTFTVATEFNSNAICLTFTYSRYGMNIKLPLLMSSVVDKKSLLATLSLNLLAGYLMYAFKNRQSAIEKRTRRRYRVNAPKIEKLRKILDEKIEDLYLTSTLPSLEKNLSQGGVLVIKAILGKPKKVISHYKNERRMLGGVKVICSGDPIRMFKDEIARRGTQEYSSLNSEIIEIGAILQEMTDSLALEVCIPELLKIDEVFNPSFDQGIKPYLFLKFYLRGYLYLALLKGDEKRRYYAGSPDLNKISPSFFESLFL